MSKFFERKQNYKWLHSQVENYTNRIQDLEKNIEIHQLLILSIIQSKYSESPTESTSSFSSKQFESMLNENILLSKNLKSSIEELNTANCKVFLSEQILNDVSQRLKEIAEEYTEKINEYVFSMEVKKKVADELAQSNKKLIELFDGYVKKKSVEVVPLREDILEIYQNTEWIKGKIQEMARMCFMADEFRVILLDFVKKVISAQQKVQALLKNPINRKMGSERFQFTQENIEESSESYESSEIEVSEINRTVTVSKQSSVVPKIDFSKINKSKSLLTHQDLEMPSKQLSAQLKELKIVYKFLNSSIIQQSEELEQISKENFKLQQQNVKLAKELEASEEKLKVEEISGLNIIEEENEFN